MERNDKDFELEYDPSMDLEIDDLIFDEAQTVAGYDDTYEDEYGDEDVYNFDAEDDYYEDEDDEDDYADEDEYGEALDAMAMDELTRRVMYRMRTEMPDQYRKAMSTHGDGFLRDLVGLTILEELLFRRRHHPFFFRRRRFHHRF